MELNGITSSVNRHLHFIHNICMNNEVWALKNKEGIALSTSCEYVNTNNEPLVLMCFWSENQKATLCAQEDWHDYTPFRIPLDDFIELYCLDLANEGMLIGTEFDQHMKGHEIDPLDLVLEINNHLLSINKNIKLKHYPNLQTLVNEIEDLMEE